MVQIYEQYPLLIKAINFINISNKSNNLPYHGIDHLFEVMRFCYVTMENDDLCKESMINKKELLIAALFHDYNHSGGKETDDVNITYAIDGVKLFYNENPVFDLDEVISLIKITQYPYTVLESDLTLSGKILRDSDLCYLFHDLSIVKLYSGLRSEFGNSLSDFLKNQTNFLESVNFNIERNYLMWNNLYKDIRFRELNMLING